MLYYTRLEVVSGGNKYISIAILVCPGTFRTQVVFLHLCAGNEQYRATETLIQKSCYVGRDLNPRFSEYKSRITPKLALLMRRLCGLGITFWVSLKSTV